MNWPTVLYAALAAGAGCCIAVQAAANGRLRLTLTGDGPEWAGMAWAAYFSICGTILSATVAMLVLRPPFPAKEAVQATQWWNWIGGPLGALIVLAGAALLPKLQAGPFICLVVGGQIVCSMALDHFGLLGVPVQPLSVGKIVGALLVVVGVVCVKFL